MGFKIYRETMGDELYYKKMKEADQVCELLNYIKVYEKWRKVNSRLCKTADLISFLQTLVCFIRVRETNIP